jgi:hypothetical protein
MTISEPRLRTLLRQAEKVATAGKRSAAITLYRQLIEEAPEAEAAWIGLAELVSDLAEKTAAYQRVLELNPQNEAALAGLAALGDGATQSISREGAADPFEQSREWLAEATEKKANVETAVAETNETAPEVKTEAVILSADQDHDHTPTGDGTTGDNFILACYRHPNQDTSLRCYSCGKPICIKCAQKTPVGYSCPDCLRELRKGFYSASPFDYLLAFVVTLPLSIVAAYLVNFLGFFVFFVSPVVGTLIGRIVFRVLRRRRGRWLPHLVAGTVVLGAVITLVIPFLATLLFTALASPEQIEAIYSSGSTFLTLLLSGGGSLIWTGVYAFMAAGAAYYFVKV